MFRKASMSSSCLSLCLSVRPSVLSSTRENSASTGRICKILDIFILCNVLRKFKLFKIRQEQGAVYLNTCGHL